MKARISRRDFLRLTSVLTGNMALSELATPWRRARPAASGDAPSVLILLFDAMSASQLSLYGYRRRTTPNLERFAERANVYHAHYSPGSFTTPGTASLLTGLYPWTHRAINLSGLIARDRASQNLFRAIGPQHQRLAYSQNLWPNFLFHQFEGDVEQVLSPAAFSLNGRVSTDGIDANRPGMDRAFNDFLFRDGGLPGSLLFGLTERMLMRPVADQAAGENPPIGLPQTENYPIFFRLRDVFDGLIHTISGLSGPSLAYMHLWAPHEPYRPSARFSERFRDGWNPKPKPVHRLVDPNFLRPESHLERARRRCDQYIADLDAEFGRLMEILEGQGVLDHSYVIITSDHGHFIERGMDSHLTPLLYDPVVRVPLLISAPGQSSRLDVHAPTSSVDVLPTLAQLMGREVPLWREGNVLPGFGEAQDPERSVFMMDAKEARAQGPISRGSFAIRKGSHKLIYYRGFDRFARQDTFELYDLADDPEEVNDIYTESSAIGGLLREELLHRIAAGVAAP